MEPRLDDSPIDEIRAIRHQISARFDHDPGRLVAHYMAMQEREGDIPLRRDQPRRVEGVDPSVPTTDPMASTRAWLLAVADKAEALAADDPSGLPADLAEDHDHYAHGKPRS